MNILVLNPNGSAEVAHTISRSIEPLRERSAWQIECSYLQEAPLGIETDADVANVAPMVADVVRSTDADVVVVACFSDPGVQLARSVSRRPVIGIAEAAYYAALQLSERFGVVSLGPASILRHAAHIERLGLTSRLAGDIAVNMSVAEANDPHSASASIARTATTLKEAHGAGSVILGCAGMGGSRHALQDVLGVPVIDPVQAAVASAITFLDLKYNVEK